MIIENTENQKRKEAPQRPFCVDYKNAKNEIFKAINNAIEIHKVPLFLLEGILNEALHQVKEGANAEVESALKSYERQLAEYERDISDG